MIPKQIFQTWRQKDYTKVVNSVKTRIDKIKYYNPNYAHLLFNDDDIHDFVKTNYPKEIWEAFNKLNIMVAKTDFWRYLVLYYYGGVYIDIDTFCEQNLDKLIDTDLDALISKEDSPYFAQWVLIFNKKHIILEKIIEEITKNIWMKRQPIPIDNRINDIHIMTGPGVYTNSIYKILKINDRYLVKNNTNHIFYHNNQTTKLYSIDYNNFFNRKFIHELYNENFKHWSVEQTRTPLLKDGAFIENKKFKLIKDKAYLYYINK